MPCMASKVRDHCHLEIDDDFYDYDGPIISGANVKFPNFLTIVLQLRDASRETSTRKLSLRETNFGRVRDNDVITLPRRLRIDN